MTKIIVAILLALGGAGFLVYNTMGEAEYYVHTDALIANPKPWMDKDLQVMGTVVPGSIHQAIVDQKATRTFEIEWNGKRVEVHHAGSVPDTFHDLAKTIVKGHLVHEGEKLVVVAVEGESGVMAKCPSTYRDP